MIKAIISLFIIFITVFSGWSASITSVKVNGIRGYEKAPGAAGSDTSFYMGCITYTFKSEGKDSVSLDFSITKQGSTDPLPILEKSGDVGLIRQANAADTVKTAYFRVRLTGDVSGNYVANLTAEANMSSMWKLADSLVMLMTNDQKVRTLYAWTTDDSMAGFRSDNQTLSNGMTMVGWRSADGPNGIRYPINFISDNTFAIYGSGYPNTVFPTEAATGCTWDTGMARRRGQAIGEEARAYGIYCNLGPMSDLVINPRWGRAFETMGEDPYLVGKMASHQVMGLQDRKVIATPKHFTPYLKEDSRSAGQRVVITERALRELFCVPFEMDIKEGKARAIMTCYNKVAVLGGFTTLDPTELGNSAERAATNRHLVQDILRNDWGFDGVIMTDWQGSMFVAPEYAYNTDYDMDMPNADALANAANFINGGSWTADKLNKKARNVAYAKLWAWGGQVIQNDQALKTFPASVVVSQDHISTALAEARESIVLAKNESIDGVPALPLDIKQPIKLAVIGPYADVFRPGGGGSSAINPDMKISPLKGIQTYLDAHTDSKITLVTDYSTADAALVFVGVDKEMESADRESMVLPKSPVDQNALVGSVLAKVKRTIVVYTGGSASVAGAWSDAPGVVIAFYPGRNQAQAMAEIFFGEVNPSGHLCVTFPKTENDLPTYELADFHYFYTTADTAHGYFYFEKTGKTPLFWFGHGLSYTSFAYLGVVVCGASSAVSSGERFDVKVFVQNTGLRSGSDVVQLYVKPVNSTIPRRVKDLRGFSRVSLEPDQTKAVTFTLGPRDFSIYDANASTKTGQWKVMPGAYELIAGSTSNPLELVNGNGKCAVTTITIQ